MTNATRAHRLTVRFSAAEFALIEAAAAGRDLAGWLRDQALTNAALVEQMAGIRASTDATSAAQAAGFSALTTELRSIRDNLLDAMSRASAPQDDSRTAALQRQVADLASVVRSLRSSQDVVDARMATILKAVA